MGAETVISFVHAVLTGHDEAALYFLENKYVPVEALWIHYTGKWTMMNLALYGGREMVVRALVRLGANLDSFHASDKMLYNSVGFTIWHSTDVFMLSLCRSLGAKNTDAVLRTQSASYSAVELAIKRLKPKFLAYLLDEVYPERPIDLSPKSISELCKCASLGNVSQGIFTVLYGRGYNFNENKDVLYKANRDGQLHEAIRSKVSLRPTLSECLLLKAQESKDCELMTYFVKTVGLKSKPGGIVTALKLNLHNKRQFGSTDIVIADFPPCSKTALAMYWCDSCGAVDDCVACTMCNIRLCASRCSGKHANSIRCNILRRNNDGSPVKPL